MIERSDERRGPVLTTARAAEYCGIAVQTLYNLLSEDLHRAPGEPRKAPKSFKQGRLNVFFTVDLDEWILEHVTDPDAEDGDRL